MTAAPVSAHPPQDQVCVAATLGADSDLLRWVGEWVFFCCQSGQLARVKWLVEGLLERCKLTDGNSGERARALDLLKRAVVPALSSCESPPLFLSQLTEELSRLS